MSVNSSDFDSDEEDVPVVDNSLGIIAGKYLSGSDSDSDVDDKVVTSVKPSETKTKLTGMHISSDGLSDAEKILFLKQLPGKPDIDNVPKQCDYCAKWFNNKMFIPRITTNDEYQCLHCYFYLRREPMSCRIESDKFYASKGISIVNYVLLCHAEHDSKKCLYTSPLCCYLCEYKLGIVIDGIDNAALLYGDKVSTSTPENTTATTPDVSEETLHIIMNDDSLFNHEISNKGKPQLLTI